MSQRIQGSKQGDSKGSEERKGGMDRYSVLGDQNLPETKTTAGEHTGWCKTLTSEKQGRSSTIQDRSGKCLTEEQEILSRWTEYCSELYNHASCGDNAVLGRSHSDQSFVTVASMKKGKSVGVDNIHQQNLFKLPRNDVGFATVRILP